MSAPSWTIRLRHIAGPLLAAAVLSALSGCYYGYYGPPYYDPYPYYGYYGSYPYYGPAYYSYPYYGPAFYGSSFAIGFSSDGHSHGGHGGHGGGHGGGHHH